MRRIKIVIAFVFICVLGIKGQMSNTLYFMERIPQSTMLNPATQPKCNVYVGQPGFSSLQLFVGNNSLSVSSILQKGKNDTLITFMHEDADKNLFFNDLKEQNSAFIDLQWQLYAFGFRVKSWYFNFGISIKENVSASYPKDFAKLAINGIGIGDKFDLKNFGVDSRLYSELAVGASKMLNEDFTVGATIKLLNGFYDISTDNKSFTIGSVEDEKGIVHINMVGDMNLNTYIPMMENTPDTGEIVLGDIFKLKDNPQKSIKPFESYGFAFDLGASYSGFEKIVLSASIIDLGYINWNKNVNSYSLKMNYSFSGIDLKTDSLFNSTNGIIDSIKNAFKATKKSTSYTTGLPTKLYLAGEYSPVKWFGVGALSLTQYYKQEFYQQIMFSANLRPLNMLMFSFSYSVFDNGFSNLGFGTSLRLGPAQFYFVSDNIPFRYSKGFPPIPHRAMNLSFRLGFNWVFGCSNKSKEKDKPLNYE